MLKKFKFHVLFERQEIAALEVPLACVACSEIAWESILDWGGKGRERLIIYNLKMN